MNGFCSWFFRTSKSHDLWLNTPLSRWRKWSTSFWNWKAANRRCKWRSCKADRKKTFRNAMALPNLLAGTCGKGEASNLFKSGIFTDFCVWLRFVFCEHYLEYLVHQPHEDRVSIGVFSLAINFELLPAYPSTQKLYLYTPAAVSIDALPLLYFWWWVWPKSLFALHT